MKGGGERKKGLEEEDAIAFMRAAALSGWPRHILEEKAANAQRAHSTICECIVDQWHFFDERGIPIGCLMKVTY